MRIEQKLNSRRYCKACEEITGFEYDKVIGHGVCKRCGLSMLTSLKLTRKNKARILKHKHDSMDKSINEISQEFIEFEKRLEKAYKALYK